MTEDKPLEQPNDEIILRCVCCGLPIAKLRSNVLTIQSTHNGEKHTNHVVIATSFTLGVVAKAG